MLITLPHTLVFPVRIGRLLQPEAAEIPRLAPLLTYTYKTHITVYPEFGVEETVEKELSGQFDAPVEGRIERWMVAEGQMIFSSDEQICEIEEPCTHEVQFSGLCAVCGKDMTQVDYSYYSNADRATIQLAHDSTGLMVSEEEARRHEEEAKRRLLKERKLSLVVDLDQTIIHATVDPTVGEWKDDPNCVNHESVKDVQAFKLEEDISGGRGTWYYVKMRPGLKEFLERISKIYELHIYTMGTRAYAMAVKKIVDPDGSIFGERVLSRDESGSMTQKSLARLFPVDTKMVVIIDDRGDVWKWSDNLVKVRPYDFFVGIGDINSMFLPKKQELAPPPPPVDPALTNTPAIEKSEDQQVGLAEDNTAQSDASAMDTDTTTPPTTPPSAPPTALETLISMSGPSSPQHLSDQTEALDKVIEAQKESRPLARQQELQDKIDEKAAELAALAEADGHETPSEIEAPKHSVLQDNDEELIPLEAHLTAVHKQFFEEYDKNRHARKDRVSQLKKNPRKRSAPEDPDVVLSAVPDVAVIMPRMKRLALSGVVIVLSGIIPVGMDARQSDLAHWARSFGAEIENRVGDGVTHVVAARTRTAKVREAARRDYIKIVTPAWLYDSISRWTHLPEEPYEIPIHPADRRGSAASLDVSMINAALSGDEDDGESGDSDEELDDAEDTAELAVGETVLGVVGAGVLGGAKVPAGEEVGLDDPVVPEPDRQLDMSNVHWEDVDDEFNEFFGDELDSDETESVRSEAEAAAMGKRKRVNASESEAESEGTDTEMEKGEEEAGEEEEGAAEGGAGSRLAKRQKIARERAEQGSSLKVVEDAGDGSEEELDEDDLELDLEKELEREVFGSEDEEGEDAPAEAAESGDAKTEPAAEETTQVVESAPEARSQSQDLPVR